MPRVLTVVVSNEKGVDVLHIARRFVVMDHRRFRALAIRGRADKRGVEAQFLTGLQFTDPVVPPLMVGDTVADIFRLADIQKPAKRHRLHGDIVHAGVHAVDARIGGQSADVRCPPVTVVVERVAFGSHGNLLALAMFVVYTMTKSSIPKATKSARANMSESS